jgi:transposase
MTCGEADAAEVRQGVCQARKTDTIDAAAIWEAVTRPNMSFVPVKRPEQQGLSMLHSAR